jgi:DNA-binding MarR family transcriptional regulator
VEDGHERELNAGVELMKAMTRLRARLRTESAPTDMSLTWSQLTTLGRIIQQGPTTTSALAKAEHVRRQSMAETVATLQAGGLIVSAPDPDDGRQTLITATRKGKSLARSIPAAREAWLNVVLEAHLGPDEQQLLLDAAAVMNRLADSDISIAPKPQRGSERRARS